MKRGLAACCLVAACGVLAAGPWQAAVAAILLAVALTLALDSWDDR